MRTHRKHALLALIVQGRNAHKQGKDGTLMIHTQRYLYAILTATTLMCASPAMAMVETCEVEFGLGSYDENMDYCLTPDGYIWFSGKKYILELHFNPFNNPLKPYKPSINIYRKQPQQGQGIDDYKPPQPDVRDEIWPPRHEPPKAEPLA